VGIAQASLDAAVEYARSRVQFGKPISDLQAIRWMIADMATEIEAAMVYNQAAKYYYGAFAKPNEVSHGG